MTHAEAIRAMSNDMLALIIDCPVESLQQTSEELEIEYLKSSCQEKRGGCLNCRRAWLDEEEIIKSKEVSA